VEDEVKSGPVDGVVHNLELKWDNRGWLVDGGGEGGGGHVDETVLLYAKDPTVKVRATNYWIG